MNNSNKSVAVIGEPNIIKIFQAVGYDCFYETEPENVIKCCQKLTNEGYKIILVLEKIAMQINDYLNSRISTPYPIIIPIPDTLTQEQYGMERLKQNMEKAMGIKIGGNL
ncbi:MAG: hypothetical protein MJ054_01300 [Clostridia bacterium]|nr:hypothetical protein [Clostridia bacterium]